MSILANLGHSYNKEDIIGCSTTGSSEAETRANFSSEKFMSESSAIMINGKRKWVTYNTQAVDDEDTVKLRKQ